MGSAHKDVLRALVIARILTRHFLARLRYSIVLWGILAAFLGTATLLIIAPWGCTPKTNEAAVPLSGRTIRVRLLQSQDQLTLKPAGPFIYRADAGERQVNVTPNTLIPVRLTKDGWLAGNLRSRQGVLTLRPTGRRPAPRQRPQLSRPISPAANRRRQIRRDQRCRAG
jgi:hypothetical protein